MAVVHRHTAQNWTKAYDHTHRQYYYPRFLLFYGSADKKHFT